ncbi:hypothetical protein KL86DPRO_50002 [uncultured delta proteobacterium]|uniref:Uncharacterized protein n=1 Tax=uncultured delta proteobacterium TaxID=34034 RepID=A0A212J062_9DELT|nr:hypothetical protein KL86DPRO_10425 [uncultured delta proteobacterium]SBW08837.1 hypothetical protein KL86DPRO_50002 [uncultured delta proteobacterium]
MRRGRDGSVTHRRRGPAEKRKILQKGVDEGNEIMHNASRRFGQELPGRPEWFFDKQIVSWEE